MSVIDRMPDTATDDARPARDAARRRRLSTLFGYAAMVVVIVIIGLLAGKYIKDLLFNPWVVCFTLIVGGAILLWVDQLDLKPRHDDAMRYPLLMYLWIGIAQCVAMIPGVSRSGASIVAAMLLGGDKRSATSLAHAQEMLQNLSVGGGA